MFLQFYYFLSALKSQDMFRIYTLLSFISTVTDYSTIRNFCSSGIKIPPIPSHLEMQPRSCMT